MGIRFKRVVAQAKVMVIGTHYRTGGTFVRFEVLDILIPAKKEFRAVWADVHADWMKVTKGKQGKSTVEVILLVSEDLFRDHFPAAAFSADNYKLHETFKSRRRFKKPDNSIDRFVRESTRYEEQRRLYA